MIKSRILLCLAFMLPGIPAQAAVAPDPEIRVQDQDGTIVVDITYRLPVSQRVAWDVLTDFDSMENFVPNMEQSRVLQSDGRRMVVEQKGQVSFGMLSFAYDSKREIELTPYQMLRAHALSGTKMDSTTTLAPLGNGTLLSYHAVAVPDLPVPSSVITSGLGEMLGTQFKAMEREMESRSKNDDNNEPAANQTNQATVIKPTTPAKPIVTAKNSKPATKTPPPPANSP